MQKDDSSRFAIYFVPPVVAPLYQFGSNWLGFDVYTGSRKTEEWPDWTATPRQYGFHATLKAPFHLRDGRTAQALSTATKELASRWRPFAGPALKLATIGNFVALIPAADSTTLSKLAMDVVAELDEFRRPPSEAEIERRMKSALTPRQQQLLLRWGYPYVMEEWKFHMTLTGPLDPVTRKRALSVLQERCAAFVDQPLYIDALCLLSQRAPDMPFRVIARFPFEES